MTDEKTCAKNAAFVQAMMQENLNHARHVENERMSLAMGMTALVSGSWAVGGAAIAEGIAKGKWEQMAAVFGICVIVLIVLGIAKWLNNRWNDIFDDHWQCAKKCYTMLGASEAGDELYPFHEVTGETKRKFKLLYRVLTASMYLLAIALLICLYVMILHTAPTDSIQPACISAPPFA